MKLRLQTRYVLVMITLVVLIVISLAGTLLFQFRASTTDVTDTSAAVMETDLFAQLRQRGEVMVRFLAENLANPLYMYDIDTMSKMTSSTLAQKDVEYVYLYDAEGKIVHDGKEEIPLFGRILDDEVSIAAVASPELLVQTGNEVFDIAMPIYLGDIETKLLGGVRVGLRVEGVSADIRHMQDELGEITAKGLRRNLITVLATTFGLMMFALLITLLVSRSLVRPIREIASYATQIGHGDYDVTLSVERHDEIGELANAFTQMSKNLRRSSDEIRQLAYHDSLTQLPNRLMFREHLESVLAYAKRHGVRIAVMFIDLDDFKRINDTLGHSAGDSLLREFAQRLTDCVRDSDYVAVINDMESDVDPAVARLGGDEFTILLPNIHDSLDAAGVAQRILNAVTRPFIIDNNEMMVGASIGITTFPDDGDDAESLLKNADVAMYHAKDSGKNSYKFFTDSMNAKAIAKLSLEGKLRKALENDQLQLHYQPLVNAITGNAVGFEALLRWYPPGQEMISPAEFIPLAEETGLIVPIGEWVLRKACEDAMVWQGSGMTDTYVSVNISSVQLRRADIPQLVASCLRDSGLDPKQLYLELTETAILHFEEKITKMLDDVRAQGVQLWMDDFGTGYSSLSYLKRFPIDGVKIDRSFVKDIESDADDRAITSAIIAMAHSLGLTVTAEGVENEQQLKFLRERECDNIQGYLFGKPMPLKDVLKLYGGNEVSAVR